jgi:cytochrome P450
VKAAEILTALATSDAASDPYPYYAKLLAAGDVCHMSQPSPAFFVVGYSAIESILRNPLFEVQGARRSRLGAAGALWLDKRFPALRELDENSLLHINGAVHARVRRLMSRAFSPRRVASLESAAAATTASLLDDMAARGAHGEPLDFMQDFAYLLSVTTICNLLGIPRADREMFWPLATDLVGHSPGERQAMEDRLAATEAAAGRLNDYFTALAAERRNQPRDDLISALVHVHDAGDGRLSDAELLSNLNTLLLAGFVTTTNLLGNGLTIMLADPAIAAAVRQGDIAPAAFAEETLRYETPVQMTARYAAADTEISGMPVGAGSQITLLFGAGNRDPRRFADPDRFDPCRPDAGTLSFGSGPHFCLGAALARLEATVAFPLLLNRFPAIAAAGKARRVADPAARGFEYLPVRIR